MARRGGVMRCSGSERPDHLVQPALVPGSLISVDDALVDHAVNDGYSSFVGSGSSILVSLLDSGNDCLDMGTHFGAQSHVVESGFVGLSGPFPG